MPIETMVEFRLASFREDHRECILLRVSQIMALFPEQKHVRMVGSSWTLTVCDEDWDKVEKAFRSAFLGNRIRTVEARGFEKPLENVLESEDTL